METPQVAFKEALEEAMHICPVNRQADRTTQATLQEALNYLEKGDTWHASLAARTAARYRKGWVWDAVRDLADKVKKPS